MFNDRSTNPRHNINPPFHSDPIQRIPNHTDHQHRLRYECCDDSRAIALADPEHYKHSKVQYAELGLLPHSKLRISRSSGLYRTRPPLEILGLHATVLSLLKQGKDTRR